MIFLLIRSEILINKKKMINVFKNLMKQKIINKEELKEEKIKN